MNMRIIYFLIATTLSACATAPNPDPLEAMNRKTFAFNQKLDKAVLSKIAKKYQEVVPEGVRTSVSNFYANPRDLLSAVSLFIQERPGEGLSDLMRFGTNTTLGVLGLFDVATPLGFEKHNEDLGQALGYWGVEPGAYIVWPVFGPSSTRDTTTLISNLTLTPQAFVADNGVYYSLTAMQAVNRRSELLASTELVDDSSLDPYLSIRDAYFQQRKNLIYNGHPPQSPEEDIYELELEVY